MSEKKVAFVTGAGMGVGYGIALEFAKAGYDVAIHHSSASRESAADLCKKMESYGAKTLAIEGNLLKQGTVDEMFAKVEKEFGCIDVFVNNAGVTIGENVLDVTEDTWDTAYTINVKAALFCIQAAGRMMIRHKVEGHIVVVLSNQIHFYGQGAAIYPATKVALKKTIEAAAVELIPFGIHVNGIAPGYVDTGSPRLGSKERSYNEIPARRWVSLEEMGQIALFLCGPYAKSFVGSVLMVDGGATLAQRNNTSLWEYKAAMEQRFSEAETPEEMFGIVPLTKENAVGGGFGQSPIPRD